MIFSDQACMVLDALGDETGIMGEFSDEIEDAARKIRGYVVQINSEPEHIFADFRETVLATIAIGPSPHEIRGYDIGPDGQTGNRLISDGDGTTYSVFPGYIRRDHDACLPETHDRSLPDDGGRPYGEPYDADGYLSDKQSYGPDGLLACNNCGKPMFYCTNDEQYHHTDPNVSCFLAPAWGPA